MALDGIILDDQRAIEKKVGPPLKPEVAKKTRRGDEKICLGSAITGR